MIPCWFCDRPLRNNRGVKIEVDGYPRNAHAACAKNPDLMVPESEVKRLREIYERKKMEKPKL